MMYSNTLLLTLLLIIASSTSVRVSNINSQIKVKTANIFKSIATTIAICSLTTVAYAENAFSDDSITKTSINNIVVLGANGKTGKLITEKLSKNQLVQVIAGYRDISKATAIDGVKTVYADVTKIGTLEGALKDADVTIFAASASWNGGNAKEVDYLGIKNVAEECVRLHVPKLVVISSGAITKPDSFGYRITNLFGSIMEYKLKGELALIDVYKNTDASSYAIIRPGGLMDNKAEGVSNIVLNQGDTIAGEINREDVADVVVAAALSTTIPKNVVFEVYTRGNAGPLQKKFNQVSGYESKVSTNYDDMLKDLKTGIFSIN